MNFPSPCGEECNVLSNTPIYIYNFTSTPPILSLFHTYSQYIVPLKPLCLVIPSLSTFSPYEHYLISFLFSNFFSILKCVNTFLTSPHIHLSFLRHTLLHLPPCLITPPLHLPVFCHSFTFSSFSFLSHYPSFPRLGSSLTFITPLYLLLTFLVLSPLCCYFPYFVSLIQIQNLLPISSLFFPLSYPYNFMFFYLPRPTPPVSYFGSFPNQRNFMSTYLPFYYY